MKRLEDIRRAAIYLRISQDRSGKGDAIERQREDCHAICDYHKWEVVDEYVDHAISAYSGATRPAYDQLFEDFRRGRFDIVVVWKLDRLSRRVGTLAQVIDSFDDLCVFSGDFGFADLTTPDGRFMTTMFINNAEFESARKGERERRANLQRAMRGEPAIKARAPFGYDRQMNVIATEADVVREIYRLRAAGYPQNDLLRAINGEPTTNNYPELACALDQLGPHAPWSRTKIHYLLANPIYAGYVAYISEPERQVSSRRNRASVVAEHIVRGEDGSPVDGKWEPIVERAVWWKVHEMLAKSARGKRDQFRLYFGSGVYRCGVCGKPLYVASGSYRCQEPGHVSRRREPIDTLVTATIRAYLGMPNLADLLPRREDTGKIKRLEATIRDAESELTRIRSDYRAHNIDAVFYKEMYDELTETIDNARRRLSTINQDPTGILTCDDPVAAFDAVCANPVRMHDIVDYLLEVTIYPRHRDVKRGYRGFSYEGVDIKWKSH